MPCSPRRKTITRSGGIGDWLPGNATRKTARAGVAPIALPHAYIPITSAPSLIEDTAKRLELGVHPHELLVLWEIHNVTMARRHWPDHWGKIEGIDIDSITDPIITGPIFTIPSSPGSPTHRRQILLLRAEARWRDSPVYGLLQYRRGWPDVKVTIEGIEHQRNRHDVQMAQRGLELVQGHAQRGRPPLDREPELDRLADLARRWACKTNHTPDDVQWQHLAMTDVRDQKTLEKAAGKLDIKIGDIQQRARERDAQDIPLPG